MSVQARAEATRQKIIDAAVDLFEEVGYGGTSLGDILARAGHQGRVLLPLHGQGNGGRRDHRAGRPRNATSSFG